jgi:uncharacterized membrane-anchored protein YhcB (DUF1043 family)
MEAVVVTLGSLIALLTWSHEQRQRVTNKRFDNIKERLTKLEDHNKDMAEKFVLKADLKDELDDMRVWLRDINRKLDQILLNR